MTRIYRMCIGSICGDIIASRFEGLNNRPKSKCFSLFTKNSRFTDDSVLSVAIADAILQDRKNPPYCEMLRKYYKKYPNRGYGKTFKAWGNSDSVEPYMSIGNGAPMRISAVGWAYDTIDEVMCQALSASIVTHNHPDSINGAQAIAGAVFMARWQRSKESIKEWVEKTFKYEIKPCSEYVYEWHSSAKETVPQAISAFIYSSSFNDCIRKATEIGGDSDTIACMAGSIAQAYYRNVSPYVLHKTYSVLDDDLRMVLYKFMKEYVDPNENNELLKKYVTIGTLSKVFELEDTLKKKDVENLMNWFL